MPSQHHSRHGSLLSVAVLTTALLSSLTTGCTKDASAATPPEKSQPHPARPAPATLTLSIVEQQKLSNALSALRNAASHDKQKALLLSAYSDPKVLNFFKDLAQGSGEQHTLSKNQFESNAEFGKKVFAIIQDSLNQGLPAIGTTIVKLQQATKVSIQQLPAKLAQAKKNLALVTAQYEAAEKTTNAFNSTLFTERQSLAFQVQSLTYEMSAAPRRPLMNYNVDAVALVNVDGTYGRKSEDAMSTFSSRQCLLDPTFPHVKLDRRADTGIGPKTVRALANYNQTLALFLRCDDATLSACTQVKPAVSSSPVVGIQQARR